MYVFEKKKNPTGTLYKFTMSYRKACHGFDLLAIPVMPLPSN